MSKIVWRTIKYPIGKLIEWEKNPVLISERAAKHLAKQLRKGQDLPYVAAAPLNGKDGLPLLDGHQRRTAELTINQVDPKTLVPVLVPDRKLTEKEREEWVIGHRKNTGEFDPDALLNWFDGDSLIDFGFTEKELEKIGFEFGGSADAEPEIDRAAELLEKWKVVSGDMFAVGSHRLICGDCTDAATVERVMGGERAKYLFTDPPYGIDYDPQFLPEIAERHNKRLSSTNKVINDDGSLDLSFLFEYENRMIWGFPYIYDEKAKGWIVWDKQPGVESRGIVTPIEMASTTMRTGFDMVRVMWGGFYRAAGEDKQPHPTQKPLGVYSPFIDRWTKAGELIFDPFSGSAPVMVACENLHRRCRAIEISPAYVAVSLQRMQDAFPGIKIERVKHGK